ncbi:MAG: TIGR02221 family CRISPR-associated protein [Bacteroidales bacterium]|nr:TIGR02221 family CRISPR-associated protein [Bacteroidales bacterium]
MARVLISFLGTGKMKDGDNAKGEYEFANYQIDKKPYKAAFIADALIKAYSINKVILIGTVKSMWDEVYANFASDDLDSDIWEKLQKIRQSVSHESELVLKGIDNETGVEIEVPKEVIENVLPGNDSKIVFIKYGLDDAEVDDNISKILGIEDFLNENDEIYFDITHGFRSLPMVLMNCIIYLQNVSNKKLSIQKITYGNLDVSSELGYAPVIDLRKLINLSDWINGAYAFKEFGKGYQIAKLLDERFAEINRRINNLSDLMSLNYIYELPKAIKEFIDIYKLEEHRLPLRAKMSLKPAVDEFANNGLNNSSTLWRLQYNLANWYFGKNNYIASYITLAESVISYCCTKIGGKDVNKKEDRDNVKQMVINNDSSIPKGIYNIYEVKKLREIRNSLAHNINGDIGYAELEDDNGINRQLKKFIDDLANIMK